jgi:uncharacterized protein (TIGR02231 family)
VIGVLWAALALASSHPVDALPSTVVVFADRARVTRSTALELSAGRQEIVFTGLPSSTLTQTLTADVRGGGVLRGVDFRAIAASEVADRRVREIADETEVVSDQLQTELDRRAAAPAELAGMAAARAAAARALSAQLLVGTQAPGLATTLRIALAASEASARRELRSAEEARRALEQRLSALARERDSLGSSGSDTWNAVVHVDLERAGRVDVDLSYLVTGASWAPRYDLRGDADGDRVELALSAMVEQRSGEDWDGVQLTVSSAQPGLGTVVPALDPFWLQRPQPVYREVYPSDVSGTRSAGMAAPASPAPMK